VASAVALTAALICSGPAQAVGPFPDPGYQFTTVQSYDGRTPVALTCQAHPVLVNTNNEDPNLLEQAKRAISKVASTSGLNLYYAGTTTANWASPSPSTAAMDTTPIRLSFESRAAISTITNWNGSIPIGVAQVPTLGDYYYKRIPWFKVVVNVDTYEEAKASAGGQVEADRGVYTTLIHEIGHGLGLDHTDVNTQIMSRQDAPWLVDFGAGDITGLQLLGQASCATSQVAAPATTKTVKKTVIKKKSHKAKKKKKRKKRGRLSTAHSAQHRLLLPETSPGQVSWRIYQ